MTSPWGPPSSACLPPEPLQHRRLQPALPRGMSPGREERWGPRGGLLLPAPPGPAAGRASRGSSTPGPARPPRRVCGSVCLSVSHGATRCQQEPAVSSAPGRDGPARRTRSILGSGSCAGSSVRRMQRDPPAGFGSVLASSPSKGSRTQCEPDLPREPAHPHTWSGVWATPGASVPGT